MCAYWGVEKEKPYQLRLSASGSAVVGPTGSCGAFLLLVVCFWPCRVAYGILVPRPGIEPSPPAVEAQSPNHWTAREVST